MQLIYSAVEPSFAWGALDAGHESVLSGSTPPPVTADDLENDRLNRPQWVTVLPPETVETYGRENLYSLSAARISDLPDGGILLLATEQYDDQDEYAQSINELVDSFEAIDRATDRAPAESQRGAGSAPAEYNVTMAQDQIYIYYAYRSGDQNELRKSHLQQFQEDDNFDTSPVSIKSTFGPVQIHSNYIGSITSMSNMEKYVHKDNDKEFNM